jgi:hypothetical protein
MGQSGSRRRGRMYSNVTGKDYDNGMLRGTQNRSITGQEMLKQWAVKGSQHSHVSLNNGDTF